tara:strand:- start:302 stop:583 length:282 start_codon:yes stop_codon:yes gene_type:complete
VILIGKSADNIKLSLIKRNRKVKESVDKMFIIVQGTKNNIHTCLEELHPLPNAYGNAVETFKTKEDAAKLLELLWDVEISEYEENNIHVWRLH